MCREINVSDYITRLAGSLGIDTEGLVKSEEEKMLEMKAVQDQQAAAMNQQMISKMAEKATPEMVKGMGDPMQSPPSPEMAN